MDAPPPPASSPGATLVRVLGGVGLLVAVVESLIGNALALEAGPYSVGPLAGHIAVALILDGLMLVAILVAHRRSVRLAVGAAALAFAGSVGATLAGTVFLLAGQADAALYAMEGFAGVTILATILLIVWGRSPPTPAAAGVP